MTTFQGKDIKLVMLFLIVQIKPRIETEAKVFSSIAALHPLIETQAKVIRSIEAYLTSERKKIEFIEIHISNSQQKYKEAMNDSKYYEDSLRAFSLLNRLERGFRFIMNLTKERTGYLKDTRLVYPYREDLIGAAKGIVHMQITYGLNITQLANGKLVSNFSRTNKIFVENVTPMTSEDCFILGLVNHTLQGFKGQLLWMKAALRKFYTEQSEIRPVTEEILVQKICEAYYNLRDYKQALKWMKRYIALKKAHLNTEDEIFLRKLQEKVDKGDGHKTRKEKILAWKQPRLRNLFGCYENLKLHTAKSRPQKCGYIAKSSYLTYGPVKVEVLSEAPTVVMIHDVINDREIEALLKLAPPNLMSDAGVYDVKGGKVSVYTKNDNRVAKRIILDKSYPLAVKLIQRTADIIGHNRRSNVSLMVTNYGIAGFYGQHVDNLGYVMKSTFPDNEGDRLFAFIYFLSDVEQGGALVFPTLGLKVYPEKGAAIVWDTLVPSGDGDLSVSHTVCPVIRGSRWVAVSWAKQIDTDVCPMWFVHDGIMTGEKYTQWKIKFSETEAKFHENLHSLTYYKGIRLKF